jgi:hypothetical protein
MWVDQNDVNRKFNSSRDWMKSFSRIRCQLTTLQNSVCSNGFVRESLVTLGTTFPERREVYALDLAQSIRQKYDYFANFYPNLGQLG